MYPTWLQCLLQKKPQKTAQLTVVGMFVMLDVELKIKTGIQYVDNTILN